MISIGPQRKVIKKWKVITSKKWSPNIVNKKYQSDIKLMQFLKFTKRNQAIFLVTYSNGMKVRKWVNVSLVKEV